MITRPALDALGQMLAPAWRQVIARFWHCLLVFLGLAVLSLPLAASWMTRVDPARGITVVLCVDVPIAAWAVIVFALMRQNQPIAARLVPGHLRCLRTILAAGWLVLSALLCLAGTLLGLSFSNAWATAAIGSAVLTLVVARPVWWLLVWFVVPALAALNDAGVFDLLTALRHEQPLLSAAALAVLLPWSLTWLAGSGDARHRARHERARGWAQLMSDSGKGFLAAQAMPRSVRGVSWLQQAPYHAWLERSVAGATPAPVMERIALGLGPICHWTGPLGHLLVIVAAMLLLVIPIGVALSVAVPHEKLDSMLGPALWGISFGALNAVAMQPAMLRQTLWASRGEQALLMTLPGVPPGPALNRRFARRLGLQFGIAWLVVASLALWAADGFRAQTPVGLYAAASALNLGLVWGDWSRLRPQQEGLSRFGLIVAPLVTAGLSWALHGWGGVSMAWLVTTLLTLAGIIATWRWRVQCKAPRMLPAGRFDAP